MNKLLKNVSHKSPYRISLFGGGSDIPWYYEIETGRVVSFTIDKYIY